MTAVPLDHLSIRRLDTVTLADVAALATVLIDCVEGGASVGFMMPMTPAKAEAFWVGIAADVAGGKRLLLAAEAAGQWVGTVQVVLAQPENQPHRADIAKMLVVRRARGRGVGAALLRAAEDHARTCGKTLLVLDTVTDSPAERLYRRLGWERCGVIPDYALWPHGGLTSTSVYYRRLG